MGKKLFGTRFYKDCFERHCSWERSCLVQGSTKTVVLKGTVHRKEADWYKTKLNACTNFALHCLKELEDGVLRAAYFECLVMYKTLFQISRYM